MKIIHTSDWHLGQSFYGKTRAREHKQFLSWLVAQVNVYNVDAIIVAGDIFDTATPPSYARELYNQFIVDLYPTRCQLIILGGNHDSVSVLNESKQLVSGFNTHLIASTGGDKLENQVIELNHIQNQTSLKNLTQVGAIVCAIPFIRPRDLVKGAAGQNVSDKQHDLHQAIQAHYQAIYEQAQQKQHALPYPVPIIMTGHLTAVGASVSEAKATDSVRDIYIGTLEAFNANTFPPADYIALGHIHRSQLVAKREQIRYSGSPIALSFDELKQDKSVNLVSFENGKLADVSLISVPQFQSMQMIKGNLATIEARLSEFEPYDALQDTSNLANDDEVTWLDIEVESDDYLSDLQSRIAPWIENKPVELLLLRRSRSVNRSTLKATQNETLAEVKPEDVFKRLLERENLTGAEHEERVNSLTQHFKRAKFQVENPDIDRLDTSNVGEEFNETATQPIAQPATHPISTIDLLSTSSDENN